MVSLILIQKRNNNRQLIHNPITEKSVLQNLSVYRKYTPVFRPESCNFYGIFTGGETGDSDLFCGEFCDTDVL